MMLGVVNCPQWSFAPVRGGGRCAVQNRTVSFGICRACLKAGGPVVAAATSSVSHLGSTIGAASHAGSVVDSTTRPGNLLHALVSAMGFATCDSCVCMRNRMNALGWRGCWQERGAIARHLIEQIKAAA